MASLSPLLRHPGPLVCGQCCNSNRQDGLKRLPVKPSYFLPNYILEWRTSNADSGKTDKTQMSFLSFCHSHLYNPLPPPYPVIYKYSRCLLWSSLQFVIGGCFGCCLSPHLLLLPSICSASRSGDFVFTSVCLCAEAFWIRVWIMHVTVLPGLMPLPASTPSGPPSP